MHPTATPSALQDHLLLLALLVLKKDQLQVAEPCRTSRWAAALCCLTCGHTHNIEVHCCLYLRFRDQSSSVLIQQQTAIVISYKL
jgi:hypothetical protein